jgi:uncharacterized protein
MARRALVLLLILAGCSAASTSAQDRRARQPPAAQACAPTPTTGEHVVIHRPRGCPVVVHAEMVYTNDRRWRGLQNRRQMAPDAGMLFFFDRSSALSFWMSETYIPLDMIFITSQKRILGIVENAEPLTTTSRRVPGRSQYVLEVNGGFSRRNRIGRGMRVTFVGAPAPSAIEAEAPLEDSDE